MSTSLTARLKMVKPDPGTGENVNLATHLNGNWDKLDAALGATLCTSGARPSTPYDGQFIRETDTGRLYVYNGSDWVQILIAGPTSLAQVSVERAAGGDHAYRSMVTGDSQQRFITQANGQMLWGSGSATPDVTLYRGSANVLKTDDAFDPLSIVNENKITASLINGFAHYDNLPGFQGVKYWKDKNGIVHIDGAVEGGAASSVMFQLPVGYRPAATLIFPIWANGSLGRIDVESDGEVRAGTGYNASLSCISGINFKAEQ